MDIPTPETRDFRAFIQREYGDEVVTRAIGFRDDFVSLTFGFPHTGEYSLIVDRPADARAIARAIMAAADFAACVPEITPADLGLVSINPNGDELTAALRASRASA